MDRIRGSRLALIIRSTSLIFRSVTNYSFLCSENDVHCKKTNLFLIKIPRIGGCDRIIALQFCMLFLMVFLVFNFMLGINWKLVRIRGNFFVTFPNQTRTDRDGVFWHMGLHHRYLMTRLSLQVIYLWRHVLWTAPPFILWCSNLEILFAPSHHSLLFTGGLRCQAIQTEHGPYIAERNQKAVYIVRCLWAACKQWKEWQCWPNFNVISIYCKFDGKNT
jgi:hypothetical protein